MAESRLFYFRPQAVPQDDRTLEVDVCVYGGVAGGVTAAVQAARMGRTVLLLEPGDHLGGMTSGGLGWTDFGKKHAIGGLARQFYRDAGALYGREEEAWRFEPHVAERVFRDWVEAHDVPVLFRRYVDGIEMEGRRIAALRCLGGLTVRAKTFLDCTYEGDLMARAGVRYTVGREACETYGEEHNGVQVRDTHQFAYPVDPYRQAGSPGSGLLPGIDPAPLGPIGSGDDRIQAYNFRMCLTRVPDNRIPFPRPEGYDPAEYELLLRYLEGGWNEVFGKFDLIPGEKTDTNNHGAVSTDYIGRNHAYPEADYAGRERIFQDHVRWQQGLMWTLANHPRVPEAIREEMSGWGLAADEFTDCGGWPFQLYVREARRMVSDRVLTEHHVFGRETAEDPVGLASYGMDSHNCRRFVREGAARNEGDVQVHGFDPYPVSYRAIVPRRGECENLAVPVCLSASHIAFGSIRMEPPFMVLGQSAATAACIALEEGCAMHDVPQAALRERLLADGQVLG